MNARDVSITKDEVRLLLGAASTDAVLVYLYIKSENDPAMAEKELKLTASRYNCAAATLRQMGLWPEEKRETLPLGQRPNYSEQDIMEAMGSDRSFKMLRGEVERLLGKAMTTEELKLLLGIERYLGLPSEVISVLVNYCRERQRQRGNYRPPTLRSIEKEAYAWAERGIDTMEEAAAYIQNQNLHNTRMAHIKHLLQIRGRWLTAAEEKYAQNWVEMGFDDKAILMAYERTCLNTGGLKWPYMNSILKRWHEAGLHTGQQILDGDRRQPASERRDLDEDELAAIKRMMQEA